MNIKLEAKTLATSIHNIMKRHGYGLGEVGYYFKEYINEEVEFGTPKGEAEEIAKLAKQYLEMMVELE